MLQLVLDTIPQRVFWKDRNSVYVGCNAPLARDAGFERAAELVGLTDYETNWRAQADAFRADDRRVMESGVPKLNYLEPQTRPDGSEGWSRTSKLPLRDRGGNIIGVLGMYEEVTDQIRSEQALRRSEQFLDSIVENIPDMIFVKDRDLRYVRFNRAGERLLGRSSAELAGKCDRDIHPPVEADQYAAKDREVMAGRKLVDVPEEAHSAGPLGPRILHTKKIPILDDAGEPLYLLGISEDITDRKRAEEELRQSEERYRHLIDSTTDYVVSVVLTGGGWVVSWHSPGSLAVTGYAPEELSLDPGQLLEIVLPADRTLVADTLRRVEEGERVPPLEHRVVRKDGSTRWVRNTIVSRFEGARVVAYDALVQDVTERRALQQQLLEAQKMEGIGRLAGGVAHDFNNLLTAILGYVEMARLDLPADLPPDHPIKTDLAEIGVAGERASTLTHQLLTFASKQSVAPVRLDLSALVADLLKILRPLLGENVAVETALEPGIGCIEADPGQIQQLLVNLAANARDAMPGGGRFTIETSAEEITRAGASKHAGLRIGPHVCLSVSDTGVGMTEEVRSHLFEPFFTTKERGKGTGLGLAICHGIVRQIGGQIRVFSEVGSGTTFRILLPRVEGPAEAPPEARDPAPSPSGTETVLVVEDEPMVRRLAAIGLRAQGYTVLEASGGDEAIEIAARVGSQIDLIVSDVVMPGLSGPDLLKRIVTSAPRARRLLVSGHAESMALSDATGAGVPFLPKPFTPGRLARKVREVLDSPAEGAGEGRQPRR